MKSRESGFSLLELMIVIGLIAVLAAIVLPVSNLVASRANDAKCVQNMKTCGAALFLYAAEHRNFLPPTTHVTQAANGESSKVYWTTLIAPYAGTGTLQFGQKVLRCPSRPAFDPPNGSNYTYGLNYAQASASDELVNGQSYYTRGRIRNLAGLGGNTFIMADCEGKSYPQVYYPGSEGNWPLNMDRDHDGTNESSSVRPGDSNEVFFCHGNGRLANFLFADGSVRALTHKEWGQNASGMWGPPWPQ